MSDGSRGNSPLDHCREPRHRELFMAVLEATRMRSSARLRSNKRSAELREFYERNKDCLDLLPND